MCRVEYKKITICSVIFPELDWTVKLLFLYCFSVKNYPAAFAAAPPEKYKFPAGRS